MSALRLLPRLQSHFFGGWLAMLPFLLVLAIPSGFRVRHVYELAQYLPMIGELEAGGVLADWLWFTVALLNRVFTWSLVLAAATVCCRSMQGMSPRSAWHATWGTAREISIGGVLIGLSMTALFAAVDAYLQWANRELMDVAGTWLLRSPIFVNVVTFAGWLLFFMPLAVSPMLSGGSTDAGSFWQSSRCVWGLALWRSRAVFVVVFVGVILAYALPDVVWHGSINAVQLVNADVNLVEFNVHWSEWLVGAIQALWVFPMFAAIFASLAEEVRLRIRQSDANEMIDTTLAV